MKLKATFPSMLHIMLYLFLDALEREKSHEMKREACAPDFIVDLRILVVSASNGRAQSCHRPSFVCRDTLRDI